MQIYKKVTACTSKVTDSFMYIYGITDVTCFVVSIKVMTLCSVADVTLYSVLIDKLLKPEI